MSSKEPVRVWIDGCFDLVHFGHANVVRQAKALGDYLVVGIHSDDEITKHKGPPVFSQEERYTLLNAIKWIDEIVMDAPYMTEIGVMEDHNCDFCVHGDDISTTADGRDAYAMVKEAGRYCEVKRTEGISTTGLLNRMISAIQRASSNTTETNMNSHHSEKTSNHEMLENDCLHSSNGETDKTTSSYTSGILHYMPNALRIAEFMVPGTKSSSSILDGIRQPNKNETIIYVPGAFDLFHVGHVAFLTKCRELGSYIIVGLHSDETAALETGRIGPILTMHERFLSLIACRYVNNVILDAPYTLSAGMLDFFKINYVAVGLDTDFSSNSNMEDPMAIPKSRGIFQRIQSGSEVTTRQVIQRIMRNTILYENRNRIKEEKECNLENCSKTDSLKYI